MFRRLVGKSMKAAKRAMAWEVKDMVVPNEEELFHFRTAQDMALWSSYSDTMHGGQTEVNFALSSINSDSTTAVFSGSLSEELVNNPDVRLKRSGFAGIRTLIKEGGEKIDFRGFDTLALRVKGDGRSYISSVRTENWSGDVWSTEENTWQAFLLAPKDEWYTVEIPLERYVLTWRGRVMESQMDMNPERIVGLGFSVAAMGGPQGMRQGPGPFRLEIDWIKALRTYGHPPEEQRR